jgi:hypothetical protein
MKKIQVCVFHPAAQQYPPKKKQIENKATEGAFHSFCYNLGSRPFIPILSRLAESWGSLLKQILYYLFSKFFLMLHNQSKLLLGWCVRIVFLTVFFHLPEASIWIKPLQNMYLKNNPRFFIYIYSELPGSHICVSMCENTLWSMYPQFFLFFHYKKKSYSGCPDYQLSASIYYMTQTVDAMRALLF